MAQKDKDIEQIKQLIEIMKENDLVEVEIKHGDDKIHLKSSQPQTPAPSVTAVPMMGPGGAVGGVQQTPADQQQAGEGQKKDENLLEITSPIVGTFYESPSPDSDAYVDIGSEVNPQTVVCIVEAMKVMNEIKAETSGKIAEKLVKNGEAVEYGQVLFKVKPD